MAFVGYCGLFPPFFPAGIDHFAPSAGLHLLPETVLVLPFLNGRLKGHLHSVLLFAGPQN